MSCDIHPYLGFSCLKSRLFLAGTHHSLIRPSLLRFCAPHVCACLRTVGRVRLVVLLFPFQVHIVLTAGSEFGTDSDYFDFVVDNLPKKDLTSSWDRLGEGLHSKDKQTLFQRLPDDVSNLVSIILASFLSCRRCFVSFRSVSFRFYTSRPVCPPPRPVLSCWRVLSSFGPSVRVEGRVQTSSRCVRCFAR